MEQFAEDYTVDGASVRNDAWKELDFSGYDCVFDVAGIAHADTGHVSEETKQRYYAVNRDLTVALAEKAKREGVRQFIFMSSAIVYGDSAPVGKQRLITRDTQPNPADFYGDSKLQAEKGILPLGDADFKDCILRPPMIYGKGSRGNYPTLSKMAQKLPIFPLVDNCRSMLYIGNLVEFVRLMIKNEEEGFFFPQNAQYSNTSRLVQMIAAAHGKKILLVKGCTPPLRLLSHATAIVNKAFGSLAYDMAMSEYKEEYRKFSLEESIRLTEG
jgi:UDP-glucose 4-epimerase